mgnify:CR=1 FL=1
MPEYIETVKFDDDGYLENYELWSEDLAKTIAEEEGIYDLTGRHLEVVYAIREEFKDKGEAPTLRRLNKVHGFPTKELYQLFPGGPGKKAARIAGVKKPHGCI